VPKGIAVNTSDTRLLIGVAGVVFLVAAALMLLWPRTSSTNPCSGDCSAAHEQTTTQVTERGFPLVWSRMITVTDGAGVATSRTDRNMQRLAMDVSVLMIPLALTAIIVRISEQNAYNRD
jgi:hypothetical protein